VSSGATDQPLLQLLVMQRRTRMAAAQAPAVTLSDEDLL